MENETNLDHTEMLTAPTSCSEQKKQKPFECHLFQRVNPTALMRENKNINHETIVPFTIISKTESVAAFSVS